MKHLIELAFLLFIMFLAGEKSFSQGTSLVPEYCGSSLMDAPRTPHRPELERKAYRAAMAHLVFRAPDPVLPVVVHIIHQNGPENISNEAVEQSIAYLNEAYANTGYFDQGTGVNTGIQFCLSKRDPEDNPWPGINRVASPLTNMVMEDDDLAVKDLSRWDPTQYINIWVVGEISSLSIGQGVAGYAYFPDVHGQPEDGIVVEARWLASGDPADATVLAHEMGHYLGLYHTFEGGCANSDCLADGDRVCDTPPDNSTAPVACANPPNTCDTDTNSGFAIDQEDMINNYMDYGDWNCYSAFTSGQADRMLFFINEARASLLDSKGCLDPCPISFSASFQLLSTPVVTGMPMFFNNTSTGATSYEWFVDGILVGTAENVNYIFDSPGTYEVVLEASNLEENCFDFFRLDVEVRCAAIAGFTFDPTPPTPGTTLTFDNNSSGADEYSWILEGVLESNATDFENQFLETGFFELLLLASNGECTDTARALIPVIHPDDEFVLNGDAMELGDGCYQLTPEQNTRRGSIWNTRPISLNESFTAYFQVFLGCDDSGADGIAFAFQPISTGVGSSGGSLGFGGISPSIGIEFDTYFNGNNNDIPVDHIAIISQGSVNHGASTNLAGPVSASPSTANIEDCNYHDVKVSWDANTQTLEAYFDCDLRLSAQVNIVNDIFAGSPIVFWGFTAATGALNNRQEVCLDYLSFFDEELVICQGDSIALPSPEGANYLWMPAGDFDDPTQPHPVVSPQSDRLYSFQMTDDCGTQFTGQVFVEVSDCSDTCLLADASLEIQSTTCGDGAILLNVEICNQGVFDLSSGFPVASYAENPTMTAAAVGEVVRLSSSLAPGDCRDLVLSIPGDDPGAVFVVANDDGSLPRPYIMEEDFSFTPHQECSYLNNLDSTFFTYEPPVLDLGPDTTICDHSVYTLYAGDEFVSYRWPGGYTRSSFTAWASGTYWVLATDACGNLHTDTIQLVLTETPILAIKDTIVCAGALLSVSAISGFSDYYWSPEEAVNCLDCEDVTVRTDQSRQVRVSAETTEGCISVDTFEVTVNLIEIGADTVICSGDTIAPLGFPVWESGSYEQVFTTIEGCDSMVRLELSVLEPIQLDIQAASTCLDVPTGMLEISASGGSGDYTFFWNNGQQGAHLDSLGAGNYEVTVIDALGCSQSLSAEIPFMASPNLELSATDVSCFGREDGSITALASPPEGMAYSLDGAPFQVSGNFEGLAAGNYQLVLQTPSGCHYEYALALTEPPPILLTLPEDTLITLGDSILLRPQANGSKPLEFLWQPSEGLSCPDCRDTYAQPLKTTTFTLIAFDSTACEALSSIRVEVDNSLKIFIPNAFSPNDDGRNDRLVVYAGPQIAEVLSFQVFSRWGSLVFEQQNFSPNDPANGWDGRFNNKQLNPGAFVYQVVLRTIDGREQQVSGEVLLVR